MRDEVPPTWPDDVTGPRSILQRSLFGAPKTIAERLICRRRELNMTASQLASCVEFFHSKRVGWATLSGAAYRMFEAGTVVPDIHKIEQIAKSMACPPAWLAFGMGPTPDQIDVIKVIGTDPATGSPGPIGHYCLDAGYRQQVLDGIDLTNLCCIRGVPGSRGLGVGEIAFVELTDDISEEPRMSAYLAGGVGHVASVKLTHLSPERGVHIEGATGEPEGSEAVLLGPVVSILRVM